MKQFHGIIPPLVTPLTSEGTLDVPGLERLIEHVIKGGVHGIFILGSTGEGPALGRSLQIEMMKETERITAGRIPILTGISSASLEDSVFLAEQARKYGASAVVAAPPCYYYLGEPELADYYRELTTSVHFPLFVYNMPSMTKVYIRPALLREIVKNPGVAGYKDSSGNMPDFHDVLLSLADREDFSIFIGPEELLGEAVLFGADGGVSGGANLNPALFTSMYAAAAAGDLSNVRSLQKDIYGQRELYGIGHHQSSIIKGIKSALYQRGICSDAMVLPFNHFEKEASEKVRSVMDRLKA